MSRLRTLFAAALMLLPLSLLAAPVAAPSAFDKFMAVATGAGKTTVTSASNGTPLAAPGVPTVETDGGMPKANATGSVVNPSGNRVPVGATARIPAAEVAKAVGRAAVNLGKNAAVVVGVGFTLYQLGKELNFILSRNPDGTVNYEKTDPSVCTAAPCYGYYGTSMPEPRTAYPTAMAACTAQKDRIGLGGTVTVESASDTGCGYMSTSYGYYNYAGGVSKIDVPPSPLQLVPSNYQEFVDAVAAKSGWPSSSVIGRVLEESAAESGVRAKTGPVTVTGPATSPGTQTVTQNTTNNTTKTETTTHNHTYEGDTINTTTVTVTNITNNTTGETISSETKTETPKKEDNPPEEVANDTALPAQPKLYTPKYPDGLEGVWTQQKANLTATPLANLIGRLMPNVGSSGTCPTWNLDLTFATWADFGLRDFAPPCYVWDWARLVILVSALLLARALIFGG
jgi:hypothetical protein